MIFVTIIKKTRQDNGKIKQQMKQIIIYFLKVENKNNRIPKIKIKIK